MRDHRCRGERGILQILDLLPGVFFGLRQIGGVDTDYSAAVVEVGSYLSHAGTIAREYGMPCVVDAQHCTALIKSGDRILVDGSNGTVILLQPEHQKEAVGV